MNNQLTQELTGQSLVNLIEDGVYFREMLVLLVELGGVSIIHSPEISFNEWSIVDVVTGKGLGITSTFESAFRTAMENLHRNK